ncbi:hypothetical protein KC19_VG102300 [Ceratodon purpureus]|uniref:Uncharacterized protein n=1 Tax=Ceratodon purpureus TaxID=3225 RepID=A0A8T0HNT7_CERPU|nr:hypothetical protein KC19_VG102300 [Ceratodon purpureus]
MDLQKSIIKSLLRALTLHATVGNVKNCVMELTVSVLASNLTTSSTAVGWVGSTSTKKCTESECGTSANSASMSACCTTELPRLMVEVHVKCVKEASTNRGLRHLLP